MNNSKTTFDSTKWIESLDSRVDQLLHPGHPLRAQDSDVARALAAQRFFVQTEQDAAEAERRALLDPRFVAKLAANELDKVYDPEWSPREWWAIDIDALKTRRDAEMARVRATTARCPCGTEIFSCSPLPPPGYLCPSCHPEELERARERADELERAAQDLEGRWRSNHPEVAARMIG